LYFMLGAVELLLGWRMNPDLLRHLVGADGD
jgi:hypothetical protein